MRLIIASLVIATGLLAADTEKTHQDFRAAAAAAYQRKDYAAAKTASEAALALRPDSPQYLRNLAALAALTGDATAAIQRLQQVAALGVSLAIERDPDFAKLQGTPEFVRILRAFAANRESRGVAEVAAELPGRTGIIEGIAFRNRTGDLFLGDVHHRCIWRRDNNGKLARFSAEDEELLGILGLALDEPRGSLWAATSALPEMAGFTTEMKGESALAEFSLVNSELRRVVPVPGDGREHSLGDLIVAPDGTVYASDAKSPVIWQLEPGAEELQKLADSPQFGSLQGMVLAERALIVADFANGLFRIDLGTREITPLRTPPNVTLLGLDGLVAIPGGIVATQNGIEPQRVILIRLNAAKDAITEVTVLAAGLRDFTDLTLITLVNDFPTVVAGSGWDIVETTRAKVPPAHTVRIFQVTLP